MRIAYEVGLFNLNAGIYISVIGIIIFIFLFKHHMKNIKYITRNKHKRIDFIGFIIATLVLVIILANGIFSHYSQYKELKTGDFKTIEGKISEFKKDIKNNEFFSVNGEKFELHPQFDGDQPFYSEDFIEDLADNQYLVRIYYSGENILKVEYED